MKVEDFDYDLNENLIAQTPIKDRDTSKLLVLDKKTGEIELNFLVISMSLQRNLMKQKF